MLWTWAATLWRNWSTPRECAGPEELTFKEPRSGARGWQRACSCPWLWVFQGTTLSSDLQSTWPDISLWISHLVSLKEKAAPHPPCFFEPIHTLLIFTKRHPDETCFSSTIFSSYKINERCQRSAHSTVAIRAACLKDTLTSQADPWAPVSPNNTLPPFPNSSAGILTWTEVQVAGKSQLLILNLCTSDLARTTFYPHSMIMIYSWHIFIHYNMPLIYFTKLLQKQLYCTVCQAHRQTNKTMIYR